MYIRCTLTGVICQKRERRNFITNVIIKLAPIYIINIRKKYFIHVVEIYDKNNVYYNKWFM